MNTRSKKFVETAAEVLNAHVIGDSKAGEILRGEHSGEVVNLINEILRKAAEGGRLAVSSETSGELIGFVPRNSIPIPEPPKAAAPPSFSEGK